MSAHLLKTARPPRRRAPQERSDQILDAALQLFASHGFERTTTKAIAETAGIAEGTIYRYFASKDELLMALFKKRFIDTLPEGIRENRMPPAGPPDDFAFLVSLIQNRLTLVKEHGGLIKAVFGEALFEPALGRQIFEKGFAPNLKRLQGYFRQCIEVGEFKNFDPELLTRAFVGMVFASAFVWRYIFHQEDPQSLETRSQTLAHLFLEGIKAPAPAKPARPSARQSRTAPANPPRKRSSRSPASK